MNVIEKLKLVKKLEDEKKELETRIGEIDEELEKYTGKKSGSGGSIAEDFIEQGIDKMTLFGRTYYIHRQLWVKTHDKDGAIEEMKKDSDLKDYIYDTFHSGSLSAYFREKYKESLSKSGENELPEPDEVIPKELKDKIGLVEKVQVRSRKA